MSYLKSILISILVVVSCSQATVYYVDSKTGSDVNTGTSPDQPWYSLFKINNTTFAPGDKILFKCGSQWNNNQLWPKGSGTSGNPIIIDMYGDIDDGLPQFNGNGAVVDVIHLYNQQYWEINNLEITNYREGDDQSDPANKKRGIYVLAKDIGEVNHLHFKNLVIHHVNGLCGAGSTNTGKDNGGIYCEITRDAAVANRVKTWFKDLLFENCHIYDVDRTGIANDTAWWLRTPDDDMDWTPSHDVVVRNCTIERCGVNAVIIRVTDNALVEHCVFKDNCIKGEGNPQVFCYNTNNTVWQYCEAYQTPEQQTTMGATGFDIDGRNKDAVIQYCYSHGNQRGGIVIYAAAWTSPDIAQYRTTLRYNILQNNGLNGIRVYGGVKDAVIHNNIIYTDTQQYFPADRLLYHVHIGDVAPDNTQYYNNVIYNLDPSTYYYMGNSTNNLFSHNVFYGSHPVTEPADEYKITSDPGYIAPGSGQTGMDTLEGYRLGWDSPCIDSGTQIPAAPYADDFWGNEVPFGVIDRGVHEYRPQPDNLPPQPDPMGWSLPPQPAGSGAIAMRASKAEDENAVEYYFENLTDPSHSSGWQRRNYYCDTGLEPGIEYEYRVKARDLSPQTNETGWSQPAAATPEALPDTAFSVFERFDADAENNGWVNMSAGSTEFAYNSGRWLDTTICRDSENRALYYVNLPAALDETCRFWWEMDIEMISASYPYQLGLFGVFNSAQPDNNHSVIADRFFFDSYAGSTRGNRHDIFGYDDSGNQLYTVSEPYEPGIAYNKPVRVKCRYEYDSQSGEGKASVDVYEIDPVDGGTGEWIMGSGGKQTVIAAQESLSFDVFGIGNRTDGSKICSNISRIDNVYFSTLHENVSETYPSFGDFTIQGDLQPDDYVDYRDAAVMAGQWLQSCSGPDWCGGCDLNESGNVDVADLEILVENWLKIR
ncbi:hypothetical protein SMSP2_00242 [Limihaloglobus sulfuriphilus]|uniref:Right handed beta helix domain-containing protein n=1 Tax=Limihaloglobus sulfuriphilus TaxID=1851148 RepID=A0A1Q2MBJ9_9BACT|nr:right-handed parallel beta-helix repeat-containing protein [Limihaloglobus sulfuriphilus]AQQ69908.1 hypothetical protein SMSP2_00242 [Limihaloglobus sulfuriphilus]